MRRNEGQIRRSDRSKHSHKKYLNTQTNYRINRISNSNEQISDPSIQIPRKFSFQKSNCITTTSKNTTKKNFTIKLGIIKYVCILSLLKVQTQQFFTDALECKECAAGTENNCSNELEQFDNCEGACYRQTNADGTRVVSKCEWKVKESSSPNKHLDFGDDF